MNDYKKYVENDVDITNYLSAIAENCYNEVMANPDTMVRALWNANYRNGGQPSKLVVGGQIFDVVIDTIDIKRDCIPKYPDVDISLHLLYPWNNKKQNFTRTYANGVPRIKNVIFNDPATIVFWGDGTKTVVKCDPEYDFYDPEKGLTMAIIKKMFGNKGNYFNEIKKWTKEYYEKEAEKNDGTISVSFETIVANLEKLKQSLNINSPSEEETKE